MKQDLSKYYKLISELQAISRCKKRRATLSKQLEAEKNRLRSLNEKVEQEHDDIVKLEAKPLASLFSKILKTHTEQLEKERQEYLLAFLEYKECKNLIDLLSYELEVLNSQVFDELSIQDKLTKSLTTNSNINIVDNEEGLVDLKTVMTRLNNLVELKNESIEALDVVEKIIKAFFLMLEELDKAKDFENWGTSYNEIQMGKLQRKSNLDEAQNYTYTIKKLIIFLNGELDDIVQLQDNFEYNKPYLFGFNASYYSNLINDWVNDQNLTNALTITLSFHLNIKKLKRELKNLLVQTNKKIAILEERRALIIETIT